MVPYGAIMSAAGEHFKAWGAMYALPEKVKVPDFPTVNVGKETAKAIKEDQANVKGAAALAGDVGKANALNISAMLGYALPGGLQQAQANILDLLQGKLPESVRANVLRGSSAASMARGVGGTPFAVGQGLRELGLTSLQGMGLGMQGFNQLAGYYMQGGMDVKSMFLSASQRANLAMWQAENDWQTKLLQAQIDAQPSKGDLKRGLFVSSIGNALKSFGGGMMGGGGGGGEAQPMQTQYNPYGVAYGSPNIGQSMGGVGGPGWTTPSVNPWGVSSGGSGVGSAGPTGGSGFMSSPDWLKDLKTSPWG